MNELIKTHYDEDKPTVSARELHNGLGVTERFSNWFERMKKYGFENGEDFTGCKVFNTLARQELKDYQISIDMAKQICMLQRSNKGMEYRRYFIEVEKLWNSPESVMARGLLVAQKEIEGLKYENTKLLEVNAEMQPKALFADAVATSHTSILIGDLAKLLKQNGVDIGQKRLFEWMRHNHYLMQLGISRNMPTQKSMDLGLFEVKETTIENPDGSVRVTHTTKVTGKGQLYFINKFLRSNQDENEMD